MASYSTATAKHATLTGTTQDTVTLDTPGLDEVSILNRSGSSALAVRAKYGEAPSDITLLADDTEYVFPGGFITIVPEASADRSSVVVKVVGNGNAYSVIGSAV